MISVIILSIFGYFVYRFIFQPVNPVSIPISAPPPAKPPQPGTYTDPSKTYSVMFPAQWSVKTQDADNLIIQLPTIDSEVVNFIPVAPTDSGFGIDGLISLTAYKSDPQTILNDNNIGISTVTSRTLNINGYEAIFAQKNNPGVPTSVDDEYAIYHNGVTLFLFFIEKQGASQDVQAYDESSELPNFNFIANSVKFLN